MVKFDRESVFYDEYLVSKSKPTSIIYCEWRPPLASEFIAKVVEI